MEPKGVVIVGGGQGGFQAAVSLRSEGYQEPITLIGEEAELPYQRPPLSKGILYGKQEARHATLRQLAFYETQNIQLITGTRVTAVQPALRRVTLDSGQQLPFGSLILATGARNRLLRTPGSDLEGVCYLRTLQEAAAIKDRLNDAQSVAVIGGGFIGLEVAAAARSLGKPVTVIEAGLRLMGRVLAPVVSEYFLQTHVAQGVEVLLEAAVSELRGAAGKVSTVGLQDGRSIPADLVVVGIGVVPNAELAAACDLDVTNGIAVNQQLQTANPNIFAIGDCAEYPNIFSGTRIRLESVQNAVDHAACVAKTITGHTTPYSVAPWFWSDQFDIKLQMAGIPHGFDGVVTRGDPESRRFSTFYFRQGALAAIDSINRPAEHLLARKLIAAHAQVSPQEAADESFDLKSRLGIF